MNKTALLVAAQMLELAADEFSNHTSNDFELPNTPENLEFVKAMDKAVGDPDYPDEEPNLDGSKIYVMDWMVMRYCIKLLKEEAAKL
jgi:hypothetical protein